MAEIRNAEDLEEWLKWAPIRLKVAVASRCALRLSLSIGFVVGEQKEKNRDWRNNVVLPMFDLLIYSATTSSHGLIGIDKDIFFRFMLRSEKLVSLEHGRHSVDPSFVGAYLSFNSIEKLSRLSRWVAKIDDNRAIIEAFESPPVIFFPTIQDVKILRSAISNDVDAIERGVDLRSQPLWLDDTPDWAIRGWETLATELTKRTPYWKTLVRWYEDRLHGDDWAAAQGRPAIPKLEIARASLPDSYWKKGGKAVNEAIAKLEAYFWDGIPIDDPALRELVGQSAEEQANEVAAFEDAPGIPLPPIDAIPEQLVGAIQFDGSSTGPIDLAKPAAEDRLADGADRREDFAELRHKAQDLASEGVNRLGRLGVPLERFLALGEDLGTIRAKLLWSRINTFRIVLQGHATAAEVARLGGERDERQLDGIVADKLTDLVETSNLFVLGDPNLLELDARRGGPQELAAAKAEVAAIKSVLSLAANDPIIVTEIAADVVLEQVANVTAAEDTLAGRQAAELGAKTTRNFIGTLLRRAYRAIRAEPAALLKGAREGAYREVGKLLLDTGLANGLDIPIAMLRFIATNADRLIIYVRYAYDNVDVERIIHLIVSLF